MKHMAGNMFSRWTDFLTTDGEKPDRNRDMEFVIEPGAGKKDVLDYWQRGWQCVFDALEPLRAEDLERKVLIRGRGTHGDSSHQPANDALRKSYWSDCVFG